MKGVMYHYVRREDGRFPEFRYLHWDDYSLQLEHFARTEGFVAKDAFLEALATGTARPGIVLTFDDGFNDHLAVAKDLERRGMWGIFYIPAGPYLNGQMLNVHRIHLLLGSRGGAAVLAALAPLVTDEMLIDQHVEAFRQLTYVLQVNDEATTLVKRILNYFISYEHRRPLIDRVIDRLHASLPAPRDFYLSTEDLRTMQRAGMMIGSHSVSHRIFSKLPVGEQREEIVRSLGFLEEVTSGLGVRTFCYPYGGFHTFTADTERLLEEAGCRFSFNVEARDIADTDLQARRQALPRYDCNLFLHGQARGGEVLPAMAAAAIG